MEKSSDGKLAFIKFARVITYLVYFYFVIATVFLITGFLLLLFGANSDASFVRFVYHIAAEFLQPFRGIFPVHQISDRSYFSASGLFAIIFYGLSAVAIHALINYITLKQTTHQNELIEAQQKRAQLKANPQTFGQEYDETPTVPTAAGYKQQQAQARPPKPKAPARRSTGARPPKINEI